MPLPPLLLALGDVILTCCKGKCETSTPLASPPPLLVGAAPGIREGKYTPPRPLLPALIGPCCEGKYPPPPPPPPLPELGGVLPPWCMEYAPPPPILPPLTGEAPGNRECEYMLLPRPLPELGGVILPGWKGKYISSLSPPPTPLAGAAPPCKYIPLLPPPLPSLVGVVPPCCEVMYTLPTP